MGIQEREELSWGNPGRALGEEAFGLDENHFQKLYGNKHFSEEIFLKRE